MSWLIPYVDVISLLLAFLILTLAMSTINRQKFDLLTSKLSKTTPPPSLDVLKESIDQMLRTQKLENTVVTSLDEDGLRAVFRGDGVLFESGQADLTSGGRTLIGQFMGLIGKALDAQHQIAIEGHTDDVPIHTARYDSNWELSSARATVVLKSFLAAGFDARRLSAQGFADTRPAHALPKMMKRRREDDRERDAQRPARRQGALGEPPRGDPGLLRRGAMRPSNCQGDRENRSAAARRRRRRCATLAPARARADRRPPFGNDPGMLETRVREDVERRVSPLLEQMAPGQADLGYVDVRVNRPTALATGSNPGFEDLGPGADYVAERIEINLQLDSKLPRRLPQQSEGADQGQARIARRCRSTSRTTSSPIRRRGRSRRSSASSRRTTRSRRSRRRRRSPAPRRRSGNRSRRRARPSRLDWPTWAVGLLIAVAALLVACLALMAFIVAERRRARADAAERAADGARQGRRRARGPGAARHRPPARGAARAGRGPPAGAPRSRASCWPRTSSTRSRAPWSWSAPLSSTTCAAIRRTPPRCARRRRAWMRRRPRRRRRCARWPTSCTGVCSNTA